MTRIIVSRKFPEIENFLDTLIDIPYVEVNDPLFSRKLGRHLKPLTDNNILESYHNCNLKKTVYVLKSKSVHKNISNKGIEYLFDNFIIKTPRWPL